MKNSQPNSFPGSGFTSASAVILTLLVVVSWPATSSSAQDNGIESLPSHVSGLVAHTNHFGHKASRGSSRVKNSVGRRIRNFVLPNTKNEKVGLSDFSKFRYLVVVFMGTECPIGNAYVPDLIDLQKKFADKSVKVIGINPNLSDSMQDVKEYEKEYELNFPILRDDEQITVDLFGATRTPEAFVLDRRRNVCYQGRIDDRIGYDYKREKANRDDLVLAVEELVSGKPVSVKSTTALGCLITRKHSLKKKGEVTYTNSVAAILENRCTKCHHKGTAAPYSLNSYNRAREWSDMIKEVISEKRMPPWDADPRYGEFSNDLRMTPQEIQTVVAWIDDGMPYGDEKELKEPKQYPKGWTIPKPDLILKMPEEYKVPAKGTVEYKYFRTPTNFKEDKWVQAAEARPGVFKAVHHIIGFVKRPGQEFHEGLPAVAGYAPGEEPMVYPEGMGFLVPAGSEIVWQVHYTPTGKEEIDRSEIGIVFCKEKPKRPVYQGLAIETKLNIPPHAENYERVATRTLKRDVELISLMPHMHVRGKDFTYYAVDPKTKKEKVLLSIPNYDFNWQHRYRFKKPISLKAGTTIKCVAHYDNSKENPANPDPNKLVTWGDQTWEEMMIGYFNYVLPEKNLAEKK